MNILPALCLSLVDQMRNIARGRGWTITPIPVLFHESLPNREYIIFKNPPKNQSRDAYYLENILQILSRDRVNHLRRRANINKTLSQRGKIKSSILNRTTLGVYILVKAPGQQLRVICIRDWHRSHRSAEIEEQHFYISLWRANGWYMGDRTHESYIPMKNTNNFTIYSLYHMRYAIKTRTRIRQVRGYCKTAKTYQYTSKPHFEVRVPVLDAYSTQQNEAKFLVDIIEKSYDWSNLGRIERFDYFRRALMVCLTDENFLSEDMYHDVQYIRCGF